MPFCPVCNYEYIEGTKTCADCGTSLLQFELEYCEDCGETLPQDAQYCQHCGALFADTECDSHKYEPAISVCIICGKALCEECTTVKDDKYFCDDDSHIEVFEEFAVLTTTGQEYEAQMIKDVLNNTGIRVQVFSQKDHAFMMTIGEQSDIKIMVPKNKLREAESLLEDIMNDRDN